MKTSNNTTTTTCHLPTLSRVPASSQGRNSPVFLTIYVKFPHLFFLSYHNTGTVQHVVCCHVAILIKGVKHRAVVCT